MIGLGYCKEAPHENDGATEGIAPKTYAQSDPTSMEPSKAQGKRSFKCKTEAEGEEEEEEEEDEDDVSGFSGGGDEYMMMRKKRPMTSCSTRGRGSGSGAGGSTGRPVCQADSCNADLSDAKHYHRRHKICESHAKAPAVLVAGVQQRFCQQCSRFHGLPEFDDAKRSCRRRLAGHNERRRKSLSDIHREGPN